MSATLHAAAAVAPAAAGWSAPPVTAIDNPPPGWFGGHKITSASWLSAHALLVRFESIYGSDYLHQLYAGRTLVGVTADEPDRRIVATVRPGDWPEHLQLVAVPRAYRQTSYGHRLPPRPYNRARLRFNAQSWPADAKHIDVTAGTAPGEAVDPDNRLARVQYDTDRRYTVLTEPLAGSGAWNFEVAGRDGRALDGNLGDPLELAAAVLAHPPDVAFDADGNRLTVSIADQEATVTFSY